MSELQPLKIDSATQVLIAENDSLEKLLFDRNIVGSEFMRLCRSASTEILGELLRRFGSRFLDDFVELVVLSKGLCYQVGVASESILGRPLDVNFIATRREEVGDGSVRIGTSYTSFTSPAENLVIADTVASGATICAALDVYRNFSDIRRLVVISFAGSVGGARAISDYCGSRSIDLTIVYGLAAFGLATNGFDLSFLDPATMTADRHRQRAAAMFRGKPVSAVGWDFGSQAFSPRKYAMLCWIEERYWELEGTGIFRHTTPPADVRLVRGEINAFRRIYPTLADLDMAVGAQPPARGRE